MTREFVPLIDLTDARGGDEAAIQAVAKSMNVALKRSGFFIVSGHGVEQSVIDDALAVTEAFFAQPLDEKIAIRSSAPGSPRGYIPFGLETLSQTEGKAAPPDLKEGFGMGPLRRRGNGGDGASHNVWPHDPAFQAAIETYYRAMERLSAVLMELFAAAMGLERGYFTSRFSSHNSTLRLIHYPPLETAPAADQLRAGAHTDYGALTILLAQNRPGGLQVCMPDGEWTNVSAPPGTFVINIGDLMMNWSNDTWLSNSHRVVNPGDGVGEASRRYSIAYFCNPNDELLVECIPTCRSPERPAKYAPIRAGEHRLRKIEMSKRRGRA